MRTLFPKTTEEWCAKKRQFMRLLNQTDDPKMAQDYKNAINFCDRGIAGVKTKKKCRTGAIVCFVVAGIAAVILIFGLFGCNIARETMHLGGAACQDAGWLLQKGADNISTEK